jgi:hypothetical protein
MGQEQAIHSLVIGVVHSFHCRGHHTHRARKKSRGRVEPKLNRLTVQWSRSDHGIGCSRIASLSYRPQSCVLRIWFHVRPARQPFLRDAGLLSKLRIQFMHAAAHILTPVMVAIPYLDQIDHLMIRLAAYSAGSHVFQTTKTSFHSRTVFGSLQHEPGDFVPDAPTASVASALQ